ncbi:LacI family DNA-binding transcriptional regulator [Sporosarcina highlanderae]|uniref:Substrate-binding domain-containing protein n=1 Tax=Sporosarcina highlanderae TaxID=3035916 RepID=A0ABT8JL54_9BACL|nr:substrate-binding domain-containing protein [Sporosarcina highlanderae]MDN4605891.1 substrate-binding domain-containing protein [Sporosarcina highlanderae]
MANRGVTIADVANKANVSKSTVSQYLNNRFEYMSEETRIRIQNVISELDYQPNIVARSLKMKSTSTIGVIVANILHAYSTQVIRAIENVCNGNNISTIICNSDDNPKKEKEYIETLLSKQVDGLIILPTNGNYKLYQRLVKQEYPIVFLDRLVEGISTDVVLLDNEKASTIAVEHFVEQGYKDIAIVTTSIIDNITPRIERINGYKNALKKNDLIVNPDYIVAMELDSLDRGLDKVFSLDKKPDAIISGNDLTLMEILKYASKQDLKVGEDFGLITIDEVSFSSFHSPTLTTIAQPTLEMGTEAAEILLSKIINKKPEKSPKLHRHEPLLIIRESTKEKKHFRDI